MITILRYPMSALKSLFRRTIAEARLDLVVEVVVLWRLAFADPLAHRARLGVVDVDDSCLPSGRPGRDGCEYDGVGILIRRPETGASGGLESAGRPLFLGALRVTVAVHELSALTLRPLWWPRGGSVGSFRARGGKFGTPAKLT